MTSPEGDEGAVPEPQPAEMKEGTSSRCPYQAVAVDLGPVATCGALGSLVVPAVTVGVVEVVVPTAVGALAMSAAYAVLLRWMWLGRDLPPLPSSSTVIPDAHVLGTLRRLIAVSLVISAASALLPSSLTRFGGVALAALSASTVIVGLLLGSVIRRWEESRRLRVLVRSGRGKHCPRFVQLPD